jgi:hypothetical protein
MDIPFLSRLIALPFVLLIVFYILSDTDGWEFAEEVLLALPITGLALIYVFHGQIDRWWWKNHPPRLSPRLKKWLQVYSPFYRKLSDDMKERFERRLSELMRIKEFTVKREQDYRLEEDLKILLLHEFIRITLYIEDYRFEPFEHFVMYDHPFGSPQYNFLHTIEIHAEDGVVIVSREQLVQGFDRTLGFFNIGLYTAVSAFIRMFPRLNYPDMSDLEQSTLCSAFFTDLATIQHATGMESHNKLDLFIYFFFEAPLKHREIYPDSSACLSEIFCIPTETNSES